MTFNTRRTMLPTVVSDGWAAVILWPSVRIRSMSSPKRGEGLGYRCPEQAHVSIKTSAPLSTSQGQQLLQHKDHSTKKQEERASREQLVPLVGFAVGNNTDLGRLPAALVFPLKEETACCWKGPCSD